MARTMSPSPISIKDVEAINLGKSNHAISTGIGFFDHMLDQFNSHAQVGVSVTVAVTAEQTPAVLEQSDLLAQVGQHLGASIATLLTDLDPGATSRFCCPLDEALVECVLVVAPNEGKLESFTLAPYGVYGKNGRTKIGQMETLAVESFISSLAKHAGLQVSLAKIRGDNGHHIVESAFKALSRALRNLLDGTNVNVENGAAFDHLWGANSQSHVDSLELKRTGTVDRSTKETSIFVHAALDGGASGVVVDTGIDILNDIIQTLATHAAMSLTCNCKGDLHVDDHHSTEDVGIALGQVLTKAFGTKAGLNRMWCATSTVGDTMDLSNRPCLTENLSLYDDEYVAVGQALTTEMLHHFFESLTMNAHMTVHVLELNAGANVKERALATSAAFGKALKLCAAVDPRRSGKTASSKGTLSV
jgi:imidazoleglycerol-phosphate dehydratase